MIKSPCNFADGCGEKQSIFAGRRGEYAKVRGGKTKI